MSAAEDEHALTLLIMGRTATSAAKAILAAGWRAPHEHDWVNSPHVPGAQFCTKCRTYR